MWIYWNSEYTWAKVWINNKCDSYECLKILKYPPTMEDFECEHPTIINWNSV